jgi:hypothetical protein
MKVDFVHEKNFLFNFGTESAYDVYVLGMYSNGPATQTCRLSVAVSRQISTGRRATHLLQEAMSRGLATR